MSFETLPLYKPTLGRILTSGATRTSIALNGAYVNNTSGPAAAIRFIAPVSGNLSNIWVFLEDKGGTLANIKMTCKVYNEYSVVAQPGTTLRATSDECTAAAGMPYNTGKWAKITFSSPYSVTAGEVIWAVVYNSSVDPTTDYPHILYVSVAGGANAYSELTAVPYTTTNGFSSAGSSRLQMPYMIKIGSAAPFGFPFTTLTSSPYTSNQLKRGVRFTLTQDNEVFGAMMSNGSAGYESFRIYADAAGPDDTGGSNILQEFDLNSVSNATTQGLMGQAVFASFTLSAGTYKGILTFNANTTAPGAGVIEDYASYSSDFDALRDADMRQLLYGVIDGGSNTWTMDKSICPRIVLFVKSFPAIAGGGGVLGSGMRGGFVN